MSPTPQSAVDTLRAARQACREAAARSQHEATRAALKSAAAVIADELLEIEDAMHDDGLNTAWVQDVQASLGLVFVR